MALIGQSGRVDVQVWRRGAGVPLTGLVARLRSATDGRLDEAAEAEAWAASGAMALTGSPDGPPRPVQPSVTAGLRAAAGAVAAAGGPEVDGPALLGERAAIARLGRRGPVSVGGHAHLLSAADTVVCLNLARPEDVAAVPAWLACDLDPTDWSAVRRSVAVRTGRWLAERADLLGLPVGVPGSSPDGPLSWAPGDRRSATSRPPVVVELGSLWAAPLCGDLMRRSGCRVVKVESRHRPDGARRGPGAFFELLNGGKEHVVVDPTTHAGRAELAALVAMADVVVEASRPRALAQLGVDADEMAAAGTVWVSITGYGREGPRSGGVAFGDDAAVSGGLVLAGPDAFVADAVADPASGLVAAAAALTALGGSRGGMIDVAMAGVARWLTGGLRAPTGSDGGRPLTVVEPRHRPVARISGPSRSS